MSTLFHHYTTNARPGHCPGGRLSTLLPSPWDFCYVEGFSERSRIATRLEMPQALAGLSRDAELSIFRVVQECLTNLHRHAGSPTAQVRIEQQEACLRVEIEDAGKGISPEKEPLLELSAHTGVGLRGMRERLRQLGGTLQVRSNGHGTQVTAVLPVARVPRKALEPKLRAARSV